MSLLRGWYLVLNHLPSPIFLLHFSISNLLSSIFNLQSSIFNLQSSIFNLQSSILYLPSSIFHLPSSIFLLPSSIFNLQSSIFHLLSQNSSRVQQCERYLRSEVKCKVHRALIHARFAHPCATYSAHRGPAAQQTAVCCGQLMSWSSTVLVSCTRPTVLVGCTRPVDSYRRKAHVTEKKDELSILRVMSRLCREIPHSPS